MSGDAVKPGHPLPELDHFPEAAIEEELDPAGEGTGLYDTHSHIHDREHFPSGAEVVLAARSSGVSMMNVVGVAPPDWPAAIEFAQRFRNVYAICGWHPNFTIDYDPADLPVLVRALRHPKVVALGEIGFDNFHAYSPRFAQRLALIDQLNLAEQLGKPVVFHARDAYSDLLDLLEKRPSHPYLFHCFTGTLDDLRRILRLGGIIGVNGPVTYKKADELRSVIARCPPHRLVLETDSPYLAPQSKRGKRNEPQFLAEIAHAVAELHGMEPSDLADLTRRTAMEFFRIPVKSP